MNCTQWFAANWPTGKQAVIDKLASMEKTAGPMSTDSDLREMKQDQYRYNKGYNQSLKQAGKFRPADHPPYVSKPSSSGRPVGRDEQPRMRSQSELLAEKAGISNPTQGQRQYLESKGQPKGVQRQRSPHEQRAYAAARSKMDASIASTPRGTNYMQETKQSGGDNGSSQYAGRSQNTYDKPQPKKHIPRAPGNKENRYQRAAALDKERGSSAQGAMNSRNQVMEALKRYGYNVSDRRRMMGNLEGKMGNGYGAKQQKGYESALAFLNKKHGQQQTPSRRPSQQTVGR